LAIGTVALVAGVALAVVGGFQASGTTEVGDQLAFLATGTLIGLALVIAGAALFVRYSIARFMRFWLVRLVHEHRTETDRTIEALKRIEDKLK
jgi:protein-S-isoprenylcysteine O-methyltransferase Ste14